MIPFLLPALRKPQRASKKIRNPMYLAFSKSIFLITKRWLGDVLKGERQQFELFTA